MPYKDGHRAGPSAGANGARDAFREGFLRWQDLPFGGELPLFSISEILGRRLAGLAGQEVVLNVASRADWAGTVPEGWQVVRISMNDPVVPAGTYPDGDSHKGRVWVQYDKIFTSLRLDRLRGVLTLAEARDCGVLQ